MGYHSLEESRRSLLLLVAGRHEEYPAISKDGSEIDLLLLVSVRTVVSLEGITYIQFLVIYLHSLNNEVAGPIDVGLGRVFGESGISTEEDWETELPSE